MNLKEEVGAAIAPLVWNSCSGPALQSVQIQDAAAAWTLEENKDCFHVFAV